MKHRKKVTRSKKDNDVILILDDEPHHVNWLVEYLWHKKYRVELALTLADAVKKIQVNQYRLVILDLSVPLRADWKIRLAAEGELSFGGATIPVYSCPECVTRTTVLGERMELPLTFVIGPGGKPYDPARPDGEIDLTQYE